MPGAADRIQKSVHALEAGEFAPWIRRGLAVVAILGLSLFYLLHEFRGIATSQAMDQAQIGREIARGHGFTTNFVRPRAVGQLRENRRDATRLISRDTYNAPLPPLINALALLPARGHWKMNPRDFVYTGDKWIAAFAIVFFLASVVVLFFITRRLFDQRIALLTCALVLICDMMWQYSLSGLPQMLMLLLFNVTMYALLRAVQLQENATQSFLWSAAAGAGFGLLALTHALTIFFFVPALVFCAFASPLRWRGALIIFALFALIYVPWLVRVAVVSGNIGGVAIYSIYDGLNHTEAGHMRRVALDLSGLSIGFFRAKAVGNFLLQLGHLLQLFGWNIVALMFFPSLLHRFRRDETSMMRWLLLAMWAGAFLGMILYGLAEEQDVAANQLHLLFVPLMTCYGLAYLLVLWNRREIALPFARTAFLALLFIICATPMVSGFLLLGHKPFVRWPPYVPASIAVLNDWMQPDEVIASDVPWAVAWYADRRSLWLPENTRAMVDLSDYRAAGGAVNGLLLTPVSGGQNKLSDITHGEYKDWMPVILRTFDPQKFPLKWATLLGSDEYLFVSDYDRSKKTAH